MSRLGLGQISQDFFFVFEGKYRYFPDNFNTCQLTKTHAPPDAYG
jgi:hypothetical protein